MAKFYKFNTACVTKDTLGLQDLGIEKEVNIKYKILPLNIDTIVFYYPLKALKLTQDATEDDLLTEDEVWEFAEYVNVILTDGTELTIQHPIKDFEEIVNNL